ncbi:MAG: hypothetical protein KJ622_18345 [Alphaproteobacteria bacterium]|nr:hypothetical protein [Alphaproteobacteria bacterium]
MGGALSGLMQELRRLAGLIIPTTRSTPIETVESVTEFVGTRAAYVAQTTLYGYMKARMGTSFQRYFEDDDFSATLRIAAVKVAVACVDDLTIFAIAKATESGKLSRAATCSFALQCYERALQDIVSEQDRIHIPADAAATFQLRVQATDWVKAADRDYSFVRSPEALVRYAPVVEEFMHDDSEIVGNSIRFRWIEIRKALTQRMDADAVCRDWLDT